MGKNIYKDTGLFSEEKAGRIDDDGNIYKETGLFSEEKAGRIDGDGNIYKETGLFSEEKAARIDDDGNIYESTGWFSKEKVGRIDEDGNIYKSTGWFSEEKVGRIEDDKDSCFLSTACIEAKGLSDSCDELQTLRWFRDNYILHQINGKSLIEEYYDVAPQIVAAIRRSSGSREIFKTIYDFLVLPCVYLIKEGRDEAALNLYRSFVETLKRVHCSGS